ncbi:MAG: EAL domain-containing protein, partial [Gammaproteobacteria bacterium]
DGSLVSVVVLATSILINEKQVGVYGMYRDISARKSAEAALDHEKEIAEVTLHAIGDAVIRTDSEGHVDYMNTVAEELTGWPLTDAVGKPLKTVFKIVNEHTGRPASNPVSRCLKEGRVVELANHSLLISRDDHKVAVEDSAAPIIDGRGEVIGVVLVFRDVSAKRRAADALAYQAQHDRLTDLYNRHTFEQRITDILADPRQKGKNNSVLYMDLDQFKVVNDTGGHQAGDALLRRIVRLMRRGLRETDMLARLGGDEFGLLMTDCSLQDAARFAEELVARVRDMRFSWKGKVFNAGMSIGVVGLDNTTRTLSEIFSAADDACYAAKDAGRNRVCVYRKTNVDIRRRQEEMRWVARLGKAIDAGRLELYYQEIHPVSGKLRPPARRYELLVRLRDETGRLILPDHFVPAAERYGLIGKLDRWVVEHALIGLAERCGGDKRFADVAHVNVSGITIEDQDFVPFVGERLSHYALPGSAICFELTETAAGRDPQRVTNFVTAVHDMGCAAALDDFGRGVSSFSYLDDLPVDYLKIDGSFVRHLASNLVHRAIVQAIQDVATVMGIKTIAEFVENTTTLEDLHKIGVEYAQGFALHKPAPWNRVNEEDSAPLFTESLVESIDGARQGVIEKLPTPANAPPF